MEPFDIGEKKKTRRGIPELSVDTMAIYNALREMEIDEIITYEELSDLIGRDVSPNGDAYSCQASARRKCLADDGIVIECVRSVGVKRLNDEAVARTGDHSINRIKRESNRGLKRISSVQDFNSLSSEAKISHNAAFSVLGVLAHLTKANHVKKVERAVTSSQAVLPLGQTLRAFGFKQESAPE